MSSASRLRLFALVLMLSAVGLSGYSWWRLQLGHSQSRAAALDRANKNVTQLADLQAQHIEALILGFDLALRQFRHAFQTESKAGVEAIIDTDMSAFPPGSLIDFVVVDAKGYVTYPSNIAKDRRYLGDRDYFRFHQDRAEDRLLVSKPIFGRLKHNWVMPITRSIFDQKRFAGIAIITLSPEYLADSLAKLGLGPGDVSALVYSDGSYVARSHKWREVLGKIVPSNSPFLRANAPAEGVFRTSGNTDDMPRIFAWAGLKGTPLTVLVGLDEAAIFAPVERNFENARVRNAIGIGLLTALATLVSILLMRMARQQEALRRSKERFERTAEAVPVALYDYVLHPDGSNRFLYMNRRSKEILGVDAEIIMRDSSSLWSLIHPGDVQRIKEEDAAANKAGEKLSTEFRITTPAGEQKWLHVESRPSLIRPGLPAIWSGFVQDITERKRAEEALKASEFLFKESQRGAFIGSYSANFLTGSWESSEVLDRIFGIDAGYDRTIQGWLKLIHPDDVETMDRYLKDEVIAMRKRFNREYRTIRKSDGETKWVIGLGEASFDAAGNIISLIGTIQDITERKQAEAQLRLAASVFANGYDGVLIADSDNLIVDVNPAFTRITGYARDEVIGRNPSILSSGRQGPAFYVRMWSSLQENDFWRGEIWNRRKTGELYAEMLDISAVRDDAGRLQHYIGVFSDISSLKKHQEELDKIAHYDLLTGVPNRRLLADRLSQAIGRARRSGELLAVCYLDLDGFKPVNDQFGHSAGDLLLVEITKRLQALLRANDTIARLGGDEFVLLLNDLPRPEECYGILDRVLAAARTPVMIDGVPVSTSASIGVCLCPPDEPDADILLRHADQAMYRAKEAGKNRYHLFDPEQDRQIKAHRHRLHRLLEALQNNEFVLHYQPKANLATGEVFGAEALIRWQHPEEGLLAPGAFLHHVEGSDLEMAVGEWVIDSALGQMGSWRATGLNLVVSVNISARHLLQPDFTERLRWALERHPEVAPGNLELEILETAALSDMDLATQAIAGCRELGVRFALDDFGTGYSSLSYFRTLPVDILKIDQSFVRDMLVDPNDLDIVESVVKLAQVFNRPVIAEGVETLEHGALLVLIGCPLCQGYGIARPMPPEQLPAWMDQWRSQETWLSLDRRVGAREDISLMVAGKSHCNWIERLVEQVHDRALETTVELDPRRCRFGRWYLGSGATRYGTLSEFQGIGPIHEHVHVLGAELLELGRNGHLEKRQQRLAELYAARDSLLQQLDALIEQTTVPPH